MHSSRFFTCGATLEHRDNAVRTDHSLPAERDAHAARVLALLLCGLLSPRVASDAPAAARGRALFESAAVGCAECHAGPSVAKATNEDVGVASPEAFQIPSLREVGLPRLLPARRLREHVARSLRSVLRRRRPSRQDFAPRARRDRRSRAVPRVAVRARARAQAPMLRDALKWGRNSLRRALGPARRHLPKSRSHRRRRRKSASGRSVGLS